MRAGTAAGALPPAPDEELADLVLHVLSVDRHVAALVEGVELGVVRGALRVVAVDGVGRMVPVEERVVEADLQTIS